jgi:hypothetical protein
MDVFVIPVGPDRYELYCEQPFARDTPVDPPTGIIGRMRRRIEDWLRKAEQWDASAMAGTTRGRVARFHDQVMAWVAERVAEQRLLWNLRRETSVTAAHPDDLTSDQVQTIIRRTLRQDLDRHQYWVWVDGVLFLVTFIALGPLFLLIPGIANLPALYFGFRTVGHWYSRGGARHGLSGVRWVPQPCAALTELRHVSGGPAADREAHVEDIAARLHLHRFTPFYDRISKASL